MQPGRPWGNGPFVVPFIFGGRLAPFAPEWPSAKCRCGKTSVAGVKWAYKMASIDQLENPSLSSSIVVVQSLGTFQLYKLPRESPVVQEIPSVRLPHI